MGGVGQFGGSSFSLQGGVGFGQVGGTNSSQVGQMGGERQCSGVGGIGQFGGVTTWTQCGAAQLSRAHQWCGDQGARSYAGAPYSWQGAVGVGPVGGDRQCYGVGDAVPFCGATCSMVSAVGAGQTGGHQLRGGSLE